LQRLDQPFHLGGSARTAKFAILADAAVTNQLKISSAPGKGTTVTAWIPLPSPEESGAIPAAIPCAGATCRSYIGRIFFFSPSMNLRLGS
jgi:hypothetical protein